MGAFQMHNFCFDRSPVICRGLLQHFLWRKMCTTYHTYTYMHFTFKMKIAVSWKHRQASLPQHDDIVTLFVSQTPIRGFKLRTLTFSFTYRANELWTERIVWELLSVSPFILASKLWQNSLNSVRVGPRVKSGCLQFNKMLRIAWVAQALLMT